MYWRETMMGGYGNYSPFFYGGIGLMALWDLGWKGMALWKAAKRNENWWFVALLLINSMGILPICYLLFWAKEEDSTKKTKVVTKIVRVVKKKKK
jgi:hypothetical protein